MNALSPATSTESALRQKLSIPSDTLQVLVFAESTHWDPNWLYTSQEYYDRLVSPGLEQVLEELRGDPRRVYSLECMFFLRLFWEKHPELQDEIRALLNARRLRLTGSGVTTPDTLLPSEEAILRDMLSGQAWLRSIGVTQEPDLAYFPDCFGHSPNLPALLNAAGFTRTAVTRIDGMWFLSADLDLPGNFPLKGSSAETLLKRERCLDFVWKARDGAEVLCHWNAFTYGQGDMLAYSGSARIYLYPSLSKPDRSPRRIAKRVNNYVRQLAPLSRSPYLFCPIGWDFNPPIPNLGELLDRYNRSVYPSSGIWLVNAGLDDYFDLIAPYREKLPVLSLDPNPYWTGFYTSRPALKQRAFRLAERLTLNEQLGLLVKADQAMAPFDAWWPLAVSNHHDLITGTSPDRVAQEEQIPLLDKALNESANLLESLKKQAALPSEPAIPANGLPECVQDENGLHITTSQYDLRLDRAGGGCISSLTHSGDAQPLLEDPSHRLIQYNDSGGLWRMGYEYRGGGFKQAGIHLPETTFTVQEQGSFLCITWDTRLPGETFSQALWVGRDDPLLYFQLTGRAPEKTTLVLRYQLPYPVRKLRMEAPGGVVVRPPARVYRHPFWPVQHYLYLPNRAGKPGFALLLRFPGAASVTGDGTVELAALRNAIRERAYFNRFTLLGMPATGIEREQASIFAALAFPTAGQESLLPSQSRMLRRAPWSTEEERLAGQVTAQLAEIDSDQVFISAIKPAWRGEGIILRLVAPSAPGAPVHLLWKGAPVQQAWICDARERDQRALECQGQTLTIPIDRAITTIRII